MSLTLYKSTALASIENFTDSDTGEVDMEGLEAANIAVTEKRIAVVAFIKNRAAEAKAIDDAAKELAARAKAIKAGNERLKSYLALNMVQFAIDEVKALDGTFSARLLIGRDESVVIEEGAVFDDALLLPAKPREPSKELIKAAIERGEPVAGAMIVKKNRLEIK